MPFKVIGNMMVTVSKEVEILLTGLFYDRLYLS